MSKMRTKVNTDNILGKPPGARTVDLDYDLGKVLGKGAFGTVRLATNKTKPSEILACKSIAKAKLVCREDVQDVQREVAIMNHVAGHPNVVNSKVCCRPHPVRISSCCSLRAVIHWHAAYTQPIHSVHVCTLTPNPSLQKRAGKVRGCVQSTRLIQGRLRAHVVRCLCP